MGYIEPHDRSQYQIMSTMEDLVREGHPVRIIDQIIEEIVKSHPERFNKKYEREKGRPSYKDSTHLKLYLYGYFNGISSSRKLEVETHRNKEVIWLLSGLTPDHWTISNYRKGHGEEIKFVTKKFREFLRGNGYIKLKTVAIDGTKVKANTNREMLTIKKIENHLEGIEQKIEEYLKKIKENDERDKIADENDDEGEGTNNRKYIDKIVELQKKVEELQKCKERLEQSGQNYVSKADPEARLMRSRDGQIPAYNVQIAVDAENKMIADSEVMTEIGDEKMLPHIAESIKEEYGIYPSEVTADKGYHNPELIKEVEEKGKGIKIYIPQPVTNRDKDKIKFTYESQRDEFVCSAGKPLVLWQKSKIMRRTTARIYQGKECKGCALAKECTTSKNGRQYAVYEHQEWRDNYKRKMLTPLAKLKITLRKAIIEHTFGTMKYLMGKIPLKLRGKENVNTEINLYATAYNLKRLITLESYEMISQKIAIYSW